MKNYTSLEQSKKLAEILPLESTDMCYRIVAYNPNDTYEYQPYCFCGTLSSDIPCWSLAALLEQLDDDIINDYGSDLQLAINKEGGQYYLDYHDRWGYEDDIETDCYDDLVDACYEMIIKLHEQKLL